MSAPDPMTQAFEQMVRSLVPLSHSLEYNLDWPNTRANATEKVEAVVELGLGVESIASELEETHPHLVEALWVAWN